MQTAPWFQSVVIAVLLTTVLPLGYLIYRIRRSEDKGRRSPSPRSWLIIIVFGMFMLSAIKSIFFDKLPSREEIEKRLNAPPPDNVIKWQAWQMSHPYAVPLFILILCVVTLTIRLAVLIRTTRGRGWSALFGNYLFWVCLAFAMILGALTLSLFRLW
jgi:hypothetical protein